MVLIKDNSYIGVITSVRTLLKLLELNKKNKELRIDVDIELLQTFENFQAATYFTGPSSPGGQHEPPQDPGFLHSPLIRVQGLGKALPSAGNHSSHLHVVSSRR